MPTPRGLPVLVLAVLAVLLAAGGVAGAAKSDEERAAQRAVDAVATSPEAEAAKERSERRKARRRTPEAKAERDRSRKAFRRQSRVEALATARRKFERLMGGPLWKAPKLREGERVRKYTSDFAMLVDRGGGADALVESNLPLLTPDDSGDKKPVDLALERAGNGFRARNAVNTAQLPGQLTDGIELERSGIGVRLADVDRAASAEVAEDKLFYANAFTDTDVLAAPTHNGAEIFAQLRSQDSPENYVLDLTLPDGASMRSAVDGGVEIRRGDDVIGIVSPPLAWDADDEPVPVAYELRGSQVVMKVDHRGGDWLYPLMVDPIVEDQRDFRYYDSNGWTTPSSTPFDGYPMYHSRNSSSWGAGLHVYSAGAPNTGGRWYSGGQWAGWRFPALRESFVFRADFLRSVHEDQGSHMSRFLSSNWPYGGVGGLNITWDAGFPPDHVACWQGDCGWSAPNGNDAQFHVQLDGAGYRANRALAFVGGVFVHQFDWNAPTTWHDPGDPLAFKWHAPGAAASFRVWGRDAGLGMKRITFGSRLGEDVRWHGCGGDRNSRCPEYWEQWFGYNTADQPEGKLELYSHTGDILGWGSDVQRWWVGIDKTAPTIETFQNGQVKPGSVLGAGTPTLRIDAKDVGVNGAENNGVKWIDYQVDGGAWRGLNPNCGSGPCQASATLDTGPNGLAEGKHTINTRAWDGIRHSSEQGFDIIVDRTKPRLVSVEGEARRPAVDAGVHPLNIAAVDDGPAGVEKIEVFVRDSGGNESRRHLATQGDAGKPLDTVFDFDATAEAHAAGRGYAEGRTTVRVRAVDMAGNIGDDVTYDVVVDRGRPNPVSVGGTLRSASQAGQELTLPSYSVEVQATDGIRDPAGGQRDKERSGVARIEVAVDDQVEHEADQECEAGSCAQDTSWQFETANYPGGQHKVDVVVFDQVGNRFEESFTVRTACCLVAASTWGVLPASHELFFGDVDGDNVQDAIGRNKLTGQLDVMRNTGEQFESASRWGAFPITYTVQVGDADGDGLDDVVGRNPLTGDVQVARSTRTAFAEPTSWGVFPRPVELKDVDGDYAVDLVARQDNGGVTVALSQRDSYASAELWASATRSQVHFADFDGDEAVDLLDRDPDTGAVRLWASDGADFGAPADWGVLAANRTWTFGDVDGDAQADAVGQAADSDDVVVRSANGAGFDAERKLGEWARGSGLKLVDLTSDAQADLVGHNPLTGVITAARNNVAVNTGEPAPDFDPDPDVVRDPDEPITDEGSTSTPRAVSSSTSSRPPKLHLIWQDDRRLINRNGVLPPDDQGNEQDPFNGPSGAEAELEVRGMLRRFREAGGSMVRINAIWGGIENAAGRGADTNGDGSPERYNWDRLDRAVNLVLAEGLSPYLTLTGVAAEWDCRPENPDGFSCRDFNGDGKGDRAIAGPDPNATASGVFPVSDFGDASDPGVQHLKRFEEFAKAAAVHFSSDDPATTQNDCFLRSGTQVRQCRRVQTYAIWNEPNYRTPGKPATFLQRRPSDEARDEIPARLYREIYKSGFSGVRSGDSAARVWLGEISARKRKGRLPGHRLNKTNPRNFTPLHFLEAVLSPPSSSAESIEAHGIAWHPYQHEHHPSSRGYTDDIGIGDLTRKPKPLAGQTRSSRERTVDHGGLQSSLEAFNLETSTTGKRWLKKPGSSSVPDLYLTEFGYYNVSKYETGNQGNNYWHNERTKATWTHAALNRAREARTRGFVFYQPVERATRGPEITDLSFDPRSGAKVRTGGDLQDYGFFGWADKKTPGGPSRYLDGAFRHPVRSYDGNPPRDLRQYGKNPTNDRQNSDRSNRPNPRLTYCRIWRWARGVIKSEQRNTYPTLTSNECGNR